jgi:hypothetical protein
VTSREDNTHGGRRYMPYAFTEQGIGWKNGSGLDK